MRFWQRPFTEIILPSNAGPGSGIAYIDLNGATDQILFFDAAGNQVGDLEPGLIDWRASTGAEIKIITDSPAGEVSILFYPPPGVGTWLPGGIVAEVDGITGLPVLVMAAPGDNTGIHPSGEITLYGSDGAGNGPTILLDAPTVNGIIRMTAETLSQGSIKHADGSGVAETWHNAALINNFTNGAPVLKYRLVPSPANCVQLVGVITSGVTVASGTAIASALSAIYRPATTTLGLAINASTGAGLYLNLDTAGSLTLHGTWTNGNGIAINCIFPLDT